MKTLQITVYSYNELNETAKEKAINEYLRNADNSYIYEDYKNTIDKFNEVFNIKSGNDYFKYIINADTDIMNLTGLRLRKYIINNFDYILFKPKYISHLKENTKRINHKRVRVNEYKNGKIFNKYVSGISVDNECNLTGVCTDYAILKPIYDFIEYKDVKSYKYMDYEDLISECFHNLQKALNEDEDWLNSEEYIKEVFEDFEYLFNEDGTKY